MIFKRFLCLLTSIFIFSSLCIPVSAMSKKHLDKKKVATPSSIWNLNMFLARHRSREPIRNRVQTCPPDISHGSGKASQEAGSDGKNSDQEAENVGMQVFQQSAVAECPKTEAESLERKQHEERLRDQEKVLGIHPVLGYMAFISPDDVDPDFPNRINRDSIYFKVSEKLKMYYQLWKEIEIKLITLKRTWPKEMYLPLHNKWWESSTPFHINVFVSFPDYVKKAYEKAKSYPDVKFGQDDCQVKIIEHMQKEWSLEGKFFAMEMLTCADNSVWQKAVRSIDMAISMERRFLDRIKAY